MAYTVSLPFDRTMWRDDIAGSAAHVRGLATCRSAHRGRARCDPRRARSGRRSRWSRARSCSCRATRTSTPPSSGESPNSPGRLAASSTPARSRNDQVATDLRLWCKRELLAVAARSIDLQDVLLQRAEAAGDVYLPGYTHLQRAQPVLLAHHLLAHGWALARDVDRLLATRERLDVSPLGAGALAGSSLPIDPVGNAADLGFAERVRQQPRRRQRS